MEVALNDINSIMSKRIEFKKLTKWKIAARSGYRCAFLNCDRTTVGPGATADEPSITGEAAHIWHRRAGGAQPDLICTQVLHLARDLGALEHYIIEQPPQREVVRIRNVAVPYGFGTRHRAIPLLEQLSGGAPKTQ